MRGAEFDRIQANSLDNGAKISYNEYNKYSKTISKIVAARLLNAEIHNERKMNMKKTNHNSPMKRIAASATMLAVSAAMLGTSTYAWFTMNREVTVTGMSMKTKVGENLLICADNVEANYTDDLVQTREALLEPVSTINANDNGFFYTVDAAADGHWQNTGGSGATMVAYAESNSTTNSTATALGKAGYDNAFNGEYGITPGTTDQYSTAYGYVDYVYYLKAIGGSTAYDLNMTECNLIYDNTTIGSGDNAWRVAIFAQDITANGGDGTVSQDLTSASKTPISILDIDNASANWTADTAISSDTGTKAAVTNASANVTLGSIPAGQTKYFKVVARVWLEGEDKSCTNTTYAALQDKIWELGMQWEMGGTAVGTIASATNNDTGAIMAGGAVASTPTGTYTITRSGTEGNYTYSYAKADGATFPTSGSYTWALNSGTAGTYAEFEAALASADFSGTVTVTVAASE